MSRATNVIEVHLLARQSVRMIMLESVTTTTVEDAIEVLLQTVA